MNNIYKNKYQKYKEKYLSLKKQVAGSLSLEQSEQRLREIHVINATDPLKLRFNHIIPISSETNLEITYRKFLETNRYSEVIDTIEGIVNNPLLDVHISNRQDKILITDSREILDKYLKDYIPDYSVIKITISYSRMYKKHHISYEPNRFQEDYDLEIRRIITNLVITPKYDMRKIYVSTHGKQMVKFLKFQKI